MTEVKDIIFPLIAFISLIPSTFTSSESFTNYQQEKLFPFSHFSRKHYPVQITDGFSLKKSRYDLTPPIILHHEFLESPKILEKDPTFHLLFIPNTIEQRPETKGQIEEYKKALAEEAEEKEKENETSSFGKYLGGFDGVTKSYVDVRGDTYNYKYEV